MAKEDVNIKVSANIAEAIQLWKAMEAGPEGMAKSMAAMGDKGGKAAKTAGDQILAMAGRFASATAILATVVATLKKVEDAAQAASDRVAASLGSFGELQQVSRTPQEFAANVARARNMVATGVVDKNQQGMAADIVFSMVSAGYTEQEKDYIEQLGRSRFVKPEGLLGLSEGLQKYRRTFGDADAGTLPDVGNKVTKAAGIAQASIPETMKGLLESAEAATMLGMTDEQSGAGWLAVESLSANPEMATTKYKSLLAQLKKKKLWRGSLKDSVADLQRREKGGANMFKVLEEARAVEAYVDITKTQDFMAQQEQALAAAPGEKIAETQSGFLQADPQLRAQSEKMVAEGSAAITEQAADDGKEARYDAYRARKYESLLKNKGPNRGAFQYWMAEFPGEKIVDWLGLEEWGMGSQQPAPAAPAPQRTSNISVQIKGPDGLDIPHEPAAADLNDADPAVSRMLNLAR